MVATGINGIIQIMFKKIVKYEVTKRTADRPVIAETDTATTTRPTAHAAFIVKRVDKTGVIEATFAHTR